MKLKIVNIADQTLEHELQKISVKKGLEGSMEIGSSTRRLAAGDLYDVVPLGFKIKIHDNPTAEPGLQHFKVISSLAN